MKMIKRSDIAKYFENILGSIQDAEKNSQISEQLQTISNEVEQLEGYIHTSLESIDGHYQTYIEQINLLSALIEFQRQVLHSTDDADVSTLIFDFIREQLAFDAGCIFLELDGNQQQLLLAAREDNDQFQPFFAEHRGAEEIAKILAQKDLAVLLSETHQFESGQHPWNVLDVKSAIVFPLRFQGELWGGGILARKDQPLLLSDLSFINLILGVLSLMLHHRYRDGAYAAISAAADQTAADSWLATSPFLVYTLGRDGRIRHANQAAIDETGLAESDLIGSSFTERLAVGQVDGFRSDLRKLKNGSVISRELMVHKGKSSGRVWQAHLSKFELADGTRVLSVLANDITRRWCRDQVRQRNEMLDQISQFSRVMNKYLNNLLTVLVPNVSLMKSRLGKDHELRKYLNTMEKSLAQTDKLVKTFLNYRLKDIEKPQKADLNKLLVKIAEKIGARLPGKVGFRFSLDHNLPSMQLFPKRLGQLFKIFVQNSLEALKTKGIIRVGTRMVEMKRNGVVLPHLFYLPAGKYVELSFQDRGPGIDAKHLDHIFKPFFSTKIKNQGGGLGLFLAYRIVKDLKGEIFVKSIPNESTTFYIYLPLQPQVAASQQPTVPAKKQDKTRRGKILVVDDEFSIRTMLQEVFELKGYQVLSAANGREGVDTFKANSADIDLVIMDMVMPEMDGKEACLKIKALKPDQKIIIISGYSKREDLDQILKKNQMSYMHKPFQVNDILLKVEKFIGA